MKEPGKKKSSSPRPPRTRKGPKKESVLFEYFDPSAKIVVLVGDFNQWNSSIRPMKRDAGGLWKVKVLLAPGSYQYKFVVNGERWEEDPLNLHRVMNEHGTFNSIRNVGINVEGSLNLT
ncbi:MAG: isoamylase early set domain-containing protein [Nitrospira sp.]|nr:isoamylase early set domain-containing protein [Nitrospira sp.]MDH4251572.1 isoamylase early set domain-containing protein [Nitrospira sp.]MDH4342542.1 isoamylase early set domain-containing protein [Nitrospira sp.]MDH5337548.1 isoamylase early set domain-containing protein [Nitrospira sp.]